MNSKVVDIITNSSASQKKLVSSAFFIFQRVHVQELYYCIIISIDKKVLRVNINSYPNQRGE